MPFSRVTNAFKRVLPFTGSRVWWLRVDSSRHLKPVFWIISCTLFDFLFDSWFSRQNQIFISSNCQWWKHSQTDAKICLLFSGMRVDVTARVCQKPSSFPLQAAFQDFETVLSLSALKEKLENQLWNGNATASVPATYHVFRCKGKIPGLLVGMDSMAF